MKLMLHSQKAISVFCRASMAAALTMILAAPPAFAALDKTGVVDYGKILQKLPETKEAETILQTTAISLQKEIDLKNQELQKSINEYKKQLPSLKQAAKALKEKDLNLKGQAVEKFQKEQNGIFNKKQQEVTAPIRQKILAAIEAIAQKEGFTIVLEKNASFYVTPDNDLTFKVMDKLNIK